MWYLYIGIIVYVLSMLNLVYRFVVDGKPFVRNKRGDLETLLLASMAGVILCIVWPAFLLMIISVRLRGWRILRDGKRKEKENVSS